MDPQRQPFVVLVGGPDWAVELTGAEAAQLQAGVRCLIEQRAAIAAVLMPEETLELEHASSGLWLQLTGVAERWSLRFVLEPQPAAIHPARGVEGGWDQDASAAFAAALLALRLPAAMGNPA